MKTKKEAEEMSGVTLSHFTKGKGQKTLSNTDLSQKRSVIIGVCSLLCGNTRWEDCTVPGKVWLVFTHEIILKLLLLTA